MSWGFAHDASLLWGFLSKAWIFVVGLAAIGFLAIPASRWQLDSLATRVETISKELNEKIDNHGARLQKAEDINGATAVWQARVEEKLDGIKETLGGDVPIPVSKRRKQSRPKPGSGFHLFGR